MKLAQEENKAQIEPIMAKKNQTINVDGLDITIKRIDEKDYISLTDMAGRRSGRPSLVIANWLRNKDTIAFLGLWEKLFNPDFKGFEFEAFKTQAGSNSFAISPKDWIEKTNAIGIVSKPGRYGGTYAHRDVAFEFGSYVSPEFKLLLINDYQRLKEEQYSRQKLEWDYQRYLTKVNYRLHTDTIKEVIIPRIQAQQNKTPDWLIYAEEADMLNVALFGMTAKQWREENPEQAQKGNIRDFADIAQLNVLANLESTNAILIDQGLGKEQRFTILAQAAVSQYRRLVQYDDIKQIEG